MTSGQGESMSSPLLFLKGIPRSFDSCIVCNKSFETDVTTEQPRPLGLHHGNGAFSIPKVPRKGGYVGEKIKTNDFYWLD